MFFAQSRVPAFLFGLIVLSVALVPPPSRAQVNDPSAPTASVSPSVIDEVWQKASAKYDGARAAILAHVDRVNREGPFRPDWESLQNYKVPVWYKDAKFGIFIHWGVYSVPAFGSEWYPREMYIQGSDAYKHHIAVYGTHDKFGYKDFIPQFKAEKFDPAAWARLFKEAGAKYVVPVFEHHDGFAMYDCGLSDWTAAKMGPQRDLLGDLAKAVRVEGLYLGASSHRVEHNFFLEDGRTIQEVTRWQPSSIRQLHCLCIVIVDTASAEEGTQNGVPSSDSIPASPCPPSVSANRNSSAHMRTRSG